MDIVYEENLLRYFYGKYFKKYEDILNILEENKNHNGLCNITQKDIGIKLGYSPSYISRCLVRLERSDKCIEKIKSGIYKVNYKDLEKYGPYSKFRKYCIEINKDNSLLKLKYKEQSSLLNISIEEIKMINGYIVEMAKDINNLKFDYNKNLENLSK